MWNKKQSDRKCGLQSENLCLLFWECKVDWWHNLDKSYHGNPSQCLRRKKWSNPLIFHSIVDKKQATLQVFSSAESSLDYSGWACAGIPWKGSGSHSSGVAATASHASFGYRCVIAESEIVMVHIHSQPNEQQQCLFWSGVLLRAEEEESDLSHILLWISVSPNLHWGGFSAIKQIL